MKLLLALFAVIAAASAIPVDPWAGGWQDPWQQNPWQQNPWQQNPWQQNPWQDPWQAQHHKVHHVQAHHIHQQPPIPPLHPQPLKLDVHAHVQKIPYHPPKIHHPHLIGYEVAVHEPEVKHVVKPVHHHHSSW